MTVGSSFLPSDARCVHWLDVVTRSDVRQAQAWVDEGHSPSGKIYDGHTLLMWACMKKTSP